MTVKLVKISKCKLIKNLKGNIIKFINKKDDLFTNFGEIYFSEIKKNKIKGWNYHKRYICLLTVPYGKVKFTIYNPLNKKKKHYILSDKNRIIMQIPPKNWFSFTSLLKKSLVVNILNNIHNPLETKKQLEIKN